MAQRVAHEIGDAALDRQLASPDPDCLFSEEYRVLAADGRVLWVDERSWVERDAQGRPVSAHGLFQLLKNVLAEVC